MVFDISTHRTIGATKLTLPLFGFGSAHLGEMYAVVDEAESRATLDAAWQAGVRFYDTAPWYGRGLAEHRLGGFLRDIARDQFQITTKVGRTLFRPRDPSNFNRDPWKGGLNFEVNFDYSYDGIMSSYEQALQRLALDTVDALLVHDLDYTVHPSDDVAPHRKALSSTGFKALEELKRAGDIQAYGMGINDLEALEYASREYDPDFLLVAMPYTLLEQSSLRTGMAACEARNISIIIGAPFASGILATGSSGNGKYGYQAASEEVQTKVRGLEAVCAAHQVPLPAAALQFPLAHPAVTSIIPGAVRAAEIEQNIGLVQSVIPDAFWSDLKTEQLIDKDAPTPSSD